MNNASNNIVIRDAVESDIPVLVDLIRRAFAEVARRECLNKNEHPRATAFYTPERMRDDFARGIRYCILEIHEKALGCVAMERADDDICYLMRLAVLPEHRKQNHGERLVRHLLKQAKTAGAKQVQIGIVDSAERLKKWYETLGFMQFKTQTFEHLPFTVAFMSVEV
jgi:N-acetylglutamate synthase-like GNAT family acetyltransferase